MVVIQIQVGNNFIEDVLLDGGYGVNIINEKLRRYLGLSKPKPTLYNQCMANQTNALGFIKDFKILVHGIPYAITFTMIHLNYVKFYLHYVVRSSFAKRCQGNNIITIKGIDTIKMINVIS
jgi:hypothetical protein